MNIPVPTEELDYDEDAEELFTGPSFADDSLEEYDALEISEGPNPIHALTLKAPSEPTIGATQGQESTMST